MSIILRVLGLFVALAFVVHALYAHEEALHLHDHEHSADLCCKVVESQTALATEVVASGLEFPWALAFLPQGDLLVTEKVGRLRVIRNGVLLAPVSGLPKVAVVGHGGLLDLVLDPNFAENNLIYMSFSEYDEDDARKMGTAIARARLVQRSEERYELVDTRVIFSQSHKSVGGSHFGSRLVFARDGTLFATIGDRGGQMRAQDPLDHAGSVIRINSDGSVPQDNPFVKAGEPHALPEIFALGLRSEQGAAIHPVTGDLWTLGHGPKGGDEVNLIKGGRNYGWPVISYGRHYSGARIGVGTHEPGYEQPIYYWDPSIAPSGFAFYSPKRPAIPRWKGSLLVGGLLAEVLVRLVLEGDTVVREEHYFKNVFGRIRDVRVGPQGAVWLLTDARNGKLIRVTEKLR